MKRQEVTETKGRKSSNEEEGMRTEIKSRKSYYIKKEKKGSVEKPKINKKNEDETTAEEPPKKMEWDGMDDTPRPRLRDV